MKWKPLYWFAPALLILVVLGWRSHTYTQSFITLSSSVRHTAQVITALKNLGLEIERAESNQRGYLITGQLALLEQAEVSLEHSRQQIIRLSEIVKDNATQAHEISNLRGVVSERIAYLNQGIEFKKKGKNREAIEITNGMKGVLLMEEIRKSLSRLEETEKNVLIARGDLADQEASRVGKSITIISGFAFFFIALAMFFLGKEFTKRRLLIEELRKTKETALTALATRSTFLANMSHEIRTPLHSIIGMADVLSDQPTEGERNQCVTVIRRAGNLLMNLVNDVLDLSKIEAGKLELEKIAYDLNEIVDSVMGMISFRASQKGLELEVKVDSQVSPHLMGDPNRLRQILLNLVGNAIKFTHNGKVSLKVSLSPHSNQRLLFEIRDTGIGIAEKQKGQIFEVFNQLNPSVSRSYGGTGLGLTISRQLVELMGGKIDFTSSLGQGSTFSFEVPVTFQSIQETNSHRAPVAFDQRNLCILVADDIEDNRLLIQMYLKNLPYRLEFAHNGEAAVETFKRGGIDLILLDLHMPRMTGYEAAHIIRSLERESRSRKRTPIIALTANALKEDEEKSIAAGCDVHLTKPITREKLKKAILDTRIDQISGRNKPDTFDLVVHVSRALESLVPTFLNNRKSEVLQLVQAIQAQDWVRADQIAHAVKGVSGSFGFHHLSVLAAQIQAAIHVKDWEKLDSLSLRSQRYLENVEVLYI